MRERLRVEMRMHMKTHRERDKLRKKHRAEQVCERLEQRGTGGAAMLCRGRQSERENENVFPSRRN